MRTLRLYYFDTFQLNHRAIVTAFHAENNSVELNETIFHPQGGGQPSDIGTIGGVEVAKVVDSHDRQNIFHILKSAPTFKIGDTVDLEVSPKPRVLFSRLHSAGHLIANIVENLFPDMKAVQGHHFPGEARVEFTFKKEPDINQFQSLLATALKDNIDKAESVISVYDENIGRTVQIGSFATSSCGGTHVSSLDQIGDVTLRGTKLTKDKARNELRLRVSYDL